jgi:hypothetical protein
MKSAGERLQATGVFQTTEIRNHAFTSGHADAAQVDPKRR